MIVPMTGIITITSKVKKIITAVPRRFVKRKEITVI
jgi:hypothetical protein